MILTREQIVEMVRVFLPDQANEAKLVDKIDTHINKVVELGFLRKLQKNSRIYEVRRIIKALVDADWLTDLDEKLEVYKKYGSLKSNTATDPRSGFRLHRFEVLNWGTFHKRIWTLPPSGSNSLLTGDIGSGKSTLVDALTTLLVPPRKIVYNKAAGAEIKERSLRSYVRGFFKSEKDADTLASKSVALRDANSFSVLLAHFFNEGFNASVTLAQIFWSRDHRNPPDRFYVLSTAPLTIADTFSHFNADVLELKKRLAKQKDIRIFDSFSKYATAFRRRMGIDTPQALDLFYQTVSMKSVGNLTDFVRRHMLEAPPVQDRIQKILRQFDDLNRAHALVLKARHQVEALKPIIDEAGRFRELQEGIASLTRGREALSAFFSEKKMDLLDRRIRQRKSAHGKVAARIAANRLGLETCARDNAVWNGTSATAVAGALKHWLTRSAGSR